MGKLFTKRCERYAGYGTLDGFKLLFGGGVEIMVGGKWGVFCLDGMGWMDGGMEWDGMEWIGGGVLWKDGAGNWGLVAGFVDVEDWVLLYE